MDEFYLKFENMFRGSRENVKHKLTFYLPLIKALSKVSKENFKVLDLGCGRGEFLEILSNLNIEAEGIDINEANINFCLQKGLKVKKTDALKYLKEAPSEYFDIVSLIQVAEHLEFKYLFDLFNEVYRILKPDGIFIVEIPYIKNPYIGLHYFWMDPTHLRPIPHELLIFLGENIGFKEYKTFIINPIIKQEKVNFSNLVSFLNEVGGDASIIFFKNSNIIKNVEIQKALKSMEFKSNINYEYALQLYSYYSNIPLQNIYLNLDKVNNSTNKLNSLIALLERELNLLGKEVKYFEQELDSLKRKMGYFYEEVNKLYSLQCKLEKAVESLYATKFWKFYSTLSSFKERIKTNFLNLLRILLVETYQRPFLRKIILLFLNKNPRIKNKIKDILSKINYPSQDFSNGLDIEEKFFLKKINRFTKK